MASTTELAPLPSEELRKMHAYWRACNYLSAGMIYLRANPLCVNRWSRNTSRIGCSAIGDLIPDSP